MTTTLNRWNPVRHLEDLQQNLLTAFRPAGLFSPMNGGAPGIPVHPSWTPAIDVVEDGSGYVISAELPGMRKEDITVTLARDVVTIHGVRKPFCNSGDQSPTWHINERSFGSFERSIVLPHDVDASSLQAELKEGVLFLRLKKRQEAMPRLIEVR